MEGVWADPLCAQVLAAGLRIPGLLEVLALGPALDAKKSESTSAESGSSFCDLL